MSKPILSVENLHVYYGGIHALKGVSLNLEEGEIVTLIGSNGAGKSTLLRAISGLESAKEGRIIYRHCKPTRHPERSEGSLFGPDPSASPRADEGRPCEERPKGATKQSLPSLRGGGSFTSFRTGSAISHVDLTKIPPHKIVALGLSQVPEGRIIFANLTVKENLDVGAYLRRGRAEINSDLRNIYTLFPILKERTKQIAGTLSGGEQQMLAIARALMARPKLLLLDEPSLGIAPVIVRNIFKTLNEINKAGTTILLVEQNAHMALSIANRGYVLETGSIVLSGKSSELATHEGVKKAYLGG